MALKNNTWKLNQWYDQNVAGNVEYIGPRLLYTTGYNDSGELGQNIPGGSSRSSPVQLAGTNWKLVDSDLRADGYIGAIKTDGTLWAWGRNENGELGLNDRTYQSSPTQIPGTTWSVVTTVGRQSGMVATKTDGTLWGWGKNVRGELGLNNQAAYSSPTQIGSDTTWPTEEFKLDGTEYTVMAIKTNGELWCWGYNENRGQLGQNNVIDRSSPVQVGSDTTWKYVAQGREHTVATKTDGTLWTWGNNGNGQCGLNDAVLRSSPTQIPGTTWDYVSGSYGGLATKTDGTLWVWGLNTDGRLGLNNQTTYSSPIQIPGTTWKGPTRTGVKQAFCPKSDGTMWGWGQNEYGELGLNNRNEYSSPVQIPGGYVSAMTGTTGVTAFIKVQ